MNNVGQKFLPIGTVVMLKGGSKRLMITGFCSMAAEDQSVMYDYAGCMYPEGFLSSDQTALFNHNQIEKIYYMGLVDEEEKKFKIQLNSLVAQMNNTGVKQSVGTPVPPVTSVTPATSKVMDVPPVGPGLPGFVAQSNKVAPINLVQSQSSNGNEITTPAEKSVLLTPSNIQFDENETIVSS